MPPPLEVPRVPQAGGSRLPRRWHRAELYVVMDNYAGHERVEVRDWLARNPRILDRANRKEISFARH